MRVCTDARNSSLELIKASVSEQAEPGPWQRLQWACDSDRFVPPTLTQLSLPEPLNYSVKVCGRTNVSGGLSRGPRPRLREPQAGAAACRGRRRS